MRMNKWEAYGEGGSRQGCAEGCSSERGKKGPWKPSPLQGLWDTLVLRGAAVSQMGTQTCCKTPGLWPCRCHGHESQGKAEERSRLRRLKGHVEGL